MKPRSRSTTAVTVVRVGGEPSSLVPRGERWCSLQGGKRLVAVASYSSGRAVPTRSITVLVITADDLWDRELGMPLSEAVLERSVTELVHGACLPQYLLAEGLF